MTDIDELIKKLNESCEELRHLKQFYNYSDDTPAYISRMWNKTNLLSDYHGCGRFGMSCNNCKDILKKTLDKQMVKYTDPYFNVCCDKCTQACITFVTRGEGLFVKDEDVKINIERFDSYCNYCITKFRINEAKKEFKKPDINIMEALGDILDIFERLSMQIKGIDEKLINLESNVDTLMIADK